VNISPPTARYDQLLLNNFATISVKDDLARITGVGDVAFLGPRDYSMRVWLDPQRLASLQMTTADVIKAISEQNLQVAAGRSASSGARGTAIPSTCPSTPRAACSHPSSFEEIIVKTGSNGQNVYLKDVVRKPSHDANGNPTMKGIGWARKITNVHSYLGTKDNRLPASTLAVFQLPGSNAIATADAIRRR